MRLVPFALLAALPAALALLSGCASSPLPEPVAVSLVAGDQVAAVMPLVQEASARHGVAPEVVLAVIHVESRFAPRCTSRVGAAGLMQLMPRTAALLARRLGHDPYDLYDPAFNIDAGTAYLARLVRQFDGRLDLALAAYNAGPARVQTWQQAGAALPEFSRRYVARVLAARDRYRERLAEGTSPPEPAPRPAAEPQEPPGTRPQEPDREALLRLIRERSPRADP